MRGGEGGKGRGKREGKGGRGRGKGEGGRDLVPRKKFLAPPLELPTYPDLAETQHITLFVAILL